MPTGRRRLASPLRAAEPSSPNEAKALSNNPADNIRSGGRVVVGVTCLFSLVVDRRDRTTTRQLPACRVRSPLLWNFAYFVSS